MEEEIDLRDYFDMFKKRWKIILIIFLASTISGIIFTLSVPKVYEARLMLKIGKVRNKPMEKARTVMKIFETKSILKGVAEKLRLPATEEEIEEIKGKIYISEVAELLEIKGRGNTSQEAVDLVSAVAALILERNKLLFREGQKILKEYISGIEKQLAEIEKDIKNLQRNIEQYETTASEAKAHIVRGYMDSLERNLDRYNTLQIELREKRLEESYATEPARIIVSPMKPEMPILPKKKVNVLITAIGGLVLSFGIAAFVEYLEKSKTNKKE